MSNEANIIRIACDQADPDKALVNALNGDVPRLHRNRDIILELGIYARGIFIPSPTHLATITAEVRPYATRTDPAVVTANTSSINSLNGEGAFTGGTGQHASILLDQAQTAGFTGFTNHEKDYWLVITAITTGGKPLTLINGRAIAVEDGGNYSATVPSPGNPNYPTMEQFYSALSALNTGVIEENGYKGRWGIDANGRPVFRLI